MCFQLLALFAIPALLEGAETGTIIGAEVIGGVLAGAADEALACVLGPDAAETLGVLTAIASVADLGAGIISAATAPSLIEKATAFADGPPTSAIDLETELSSGDSHLFATALGSGFVPDSAIDLTTGLTLSTEAGLSFEQGTAEQLLRQLADLVNAQQPAAFADEQAFTAVSAPASTPGVGALDGTVGQDLSAANEAGAPRTLEVMTPDGVVETSAPVVGAAAPSVDGGDIGFQAARGSFDPSAARAVATETTQGPSAVVINGEWIDTPTGVAVVHYEGGWTTVQLPGQTPVTLAPGTLVEVQFPTQPGVSVSAAAAAADAAPPLAAAPPGALAAGSPVGIADGVANTVEHEPAPRPRPRLAPRRVAPLRRPPPPPPPDLGPGYDASESIHDRIERARDEAEKTDEDARKERERAAREAARKQKHDNSAGGFLEGLEEYPGDVAAHLAKFVVDPTLEDLGKGAGVVGRGLVDAGRGVVESSPAGAAAKLVYDGVQYLRASPAPPQPPPPAVTAKSVGQALGPTATQLVLGYIIGAVAAGGGPKLPPELEASLKEGATAGPVRRVAGRQFGAYSETRKAGLNDGHHVFQDAAMREVPKYSRRGAPAVQLDGPSTAQGSPHYNATQSQMRTSLPRGTFGREIAVAKEALVRAGLSDAAASTVVEEAAKYFRGLGVTDATPTRIPGR